MYARAKESRVTRIGQRKFGYAGRKGALALHYDFVGPTANPVASLGEAVHRGPAITFTRASSANYFDSSGVLQSAANDVARFDHDLSGTALGLLIEEARTNEALHNRDFTNAAWVKSNLSAVKDATGLDGVANSASTLTASAANGTALQTVTLASAERTFSVYVKRKTGSGNIDITDDNGTNWTTLTGLSSSAWTRHDITRTQANPVVGFRIVTSGDEIEVDFAGLEEGGFPTSPIATTTSAVTRAEDVATIDVSSVVIPTVGTFSVVFQHIQDGGSFGSPFSYTFEAASSNVIEFITWDNGPPGLLEIDIRGTSTPGDLTMAGVTPGTIHKVAFSYESGRLAASQDGGAIVEDTSVDVDFANDPITLRFGVRDGTRRADTYVREVKYWNVVQSDAFKIAVTT